MELESGRKVTLRKLTTTERIDAYDTEKPMAKMYTFAMYALGLKSLDDFNKEENEYTIDEIGEIAGETIEGAGKAADPTTKG